MAITEEKTVEEKNLSFVEQLVEQDLAEGKNAGRIQTRFPPEPNGYLHIGHAKAICMDFGVAEKYNGVCNLRFDDTNPTKENNEYVENILNDISWLGFKWGNIYYASDYFEKLWDFAVWMIKNGHAYIDEQTAEQIAEQKGTPTTPGVASPYRDRPVEESLELFNKMNTPEAVEGSMVLRAKLDMANPNMHFRDPIIYRIIHTPHHRTGTKWHAYPMYDFAHGQSDYFEGVTHSICTLEFVPHRPLYDKFIDYLKEMRGETENLHDFRPRQIEFNRLNLTYTMMSKRKLLALVEEKFVSGWDDPRMPTLSGMRRRGYSPESIRKFIDSIGYTKFDALNDMALLEAAVREDLNKRALRVSAVLNPVKLVITNYPEGQTEEMEAINNPENEADGTHTITFSQTLSTTSARRWQRTDGSAVRTTKNSSSSLCTPSSIATTRAVRLRRTSSPTFRSSRMPSSAQTFLPSSSALTSTLRLTQLLLRLRATSIGNSLARASALRLLSRSSARKTRRAMCSATSRLLGVSSLKCRQLLAASSLKSMQSAAQRYRRATLLHTSSASTSKYV